MRDSAASTALDIVCDLRLEEASDPPPLRAPAAHTAQSSGQTKFWPAPQRATATLQSAAVSKMTVRRSAQQAIDRPDRWEGSRGHILVWHYICKSSCTPITRGR